MYEIVNQESSGMDFEDIKGILFKRNGKIICTPPRPFFKDLSHLPRPAYHLLDMDYYQQPNTDLFRSFIISTIPIFTSRGCPYSCTFCANRMIYETQGVKPFIRYRPVSQIIDVIKWFSEEYGIESFCFLDDTFALPPSRAIEFCRQYHQSGLKMVWGIQSRVNLMNEELVKELSDAGCVQIDFGVESGSPKALKRMKKGITVEQTYQAFSLCRKSRVRPLANILFNTPQETEEDVRLTLQCMRKIKAAHYSIALTVPLIGSAVFEKYIGRDNFTKEDYHLYAGQDMYQRIVDPAFSTGKS